MNGMGGGTIEDAEGTGKSESGEREGELSRY